MKPSSKAQWVLCWHSRFGTGGCVSDEMPPCMHNSRAGLVSGLVWRRLGDMGPLITSNRPACRWVPPAPDLEPIAGGVIGTLADA